MIFRVLLIGLIFYFIARFVVRFVLPLFKISRLAQDRIRQMQEQMNNMQQNESAKANNGSKPIEGEYIDYEEVK